ncbi:hypothetical protein NSQ77_07115 [Oceanobacillus sp. FSL K6-2867]|uniref:hypothetical protein n=1 Tax=Oceanobacillus sp. FSL K6-2867 TaxID=2954748 RepID=UPI0030D91CC3
MYRGSAYHSPFGAISVGDGAVFRSDSAISEGDGVIFHRFGAISRGDDAISAWNGVIFSLYNPMQSTCAKTGVLHQSSISKSMNRISPV